MGYWSLDPSGAERLSSGTAEDLGFPTLEPTMEIEGKSWDGDVYSGLRQFLQGKGLEAYSQDAARELRYPLYEVSGGLALFAHGEQIRYDIKFD
jgi:hypothetical protein